MTDHGSPDRYEVLSDGPRIETRVKGSRFFARVHAVSSDDEVRAKLDAIRKSAHDATHHCWASWIGEPGAEVERFDDDGEPSGTAGKPILAPLVAGGRRNGLVVVTRYFGGTKLGTGGLIRAYGEASAEALAAAPSRVVWRESRWVVEADYEDLGTVEAVLARREDWLRSVRRDFSTVPRMHVRALRSRAESLRAELVEATAGRVRFVEPPRESEPEDPRDP